MYKYAVTTSVLRSQKAVSAYFSSKQIVPFGFADQTCDRMFLHKRDQRCISCAHSL